MSEHYEDQPEIVSAELVRIDDDDDATAMVVAGDYQMPWSDDQLRSLRTVADAVDLIGKKVDIADVAGTGFMPIRREDKKKFLCRGVGMLFVHWTVSESRLSDGYKTTAWVITDDDARYMINDSSARGIHYQLNAISSEHGITGGVYSAKGCEHDEWQRKDETGELMFTDKGEPIMAEAIKIILQ